MWQLTDIKEWSHFEEQFSWVRDMKGVPQSPKYHAEGDVATHTKMVFDALVSLPEFSGLSGQDQEILICAVLMHDIEKRSTTRKVNGEWRSPHHAKKGAVTARKLLYSEYNCPFQIREQIVALVRNHGAPIWAIDSKDPLKKVVKLSFSCNNKLLYMLAKADVLGRICEDQQEVLDRVEMFRILSEEAGCFGSPRQFVDSNSKMYYLNSDNQHLDYVPYVEEQSTVYLMSALPGSGKDHYCQTNFKELPIISLDELRRESKVRITDKKGQGRIVQKAKEQAKEYLRNQVDFVWNATNLNASLRAKLIDSFRVYGAKVVIVYVEVSEKKLLKQNSQRQGVVPEKVIRNMMNRWEVPTLDEAHEVLYVI